MDAARAAGTRMSLLDRLMLDEGRVEGIATALEDLVAALPDPLGAGAAAAHAGERHRAFARGRAAGVVAVINTAQPPYGPTDAAGICA